MYRNIHYILLDIQASLLRAAPRVAILVYETLLAAPPETGGLRILHKMDFKTGRPAATDPTLFNYMAYNKCDIKYYKRIVIFLSVRYMYKDVWVTATSNCFVGIHRTDFKSDICVGYVIGCSSFLVRNLQIPITNSSQHKRALFVASAQQKDTWK